MFEKLSEKPVAEVQNEQVEKWKEEDLLHKCVTAREGRPEFVFYEGPPTANGKPGIHHVMARTLKDSVCRYKTMKGYQVNRKAGWDTHGLPVEIEVEKQLGMSGKHKDIPAGLNLIDFEAGFSGKLDIRQDRFLRQRADGGTLSLAILPSGSYDIRERVPSIALCTEGQARVGTSTDHVMLKEGECCFIPSCDEEYHIRVAGKVFQAVFPEKA